MGCIQNFFVYIILQDINYWKRVYCWIVGPFSRIASHIKLRQCVHVSVVDKNNKDAIQEQRAKVLESNQSYTI